MIVPSVPQNPESVSARRSRNRSSAFSLIEVIVGLTIFSFMIVGILSLTFQVRAASEEAVYNNTALTLAQAYLKQMRSSDFATLQAAALDTTGTVDLNLVSSGGVILTDKQGGVFNNKDWAKETIMLDEDDQGFPRQTPPGVVTGPQAHDLIEPPDSAGTASVEEQKFANKAGLYFVVEPDEDTFGFFDPDDTDDHKNAISRTVWLTANPTKVVTPPADMIENQRRMYDWRERKWINTADFDLGKMKTAVLAASAGSADNFKVDGTDWDLDDPTVDGA